VHAFCAEIAKSDAIEVLRAIIAYGLGTGHVPMIIFHLNPHNRGPVAYRNTTWFNNLNTQHLYLTQVESRNV
jgi:hypothetical protein